MIRTVSLLCSLAIAAASFAGCDGMTRKSGEEGRKGGDGSRFSAEAPQSEGQPRPEEDSREGRLTPVDISSPVHGTSYVSPLVEVFGDVAIGHRSFVASNTILRASPQHRLEIGSKTNAQDNIVMRALKRDLSIGSETSIAHHAIIGDSVVGDLVFVGFNAQVMNSNVGDGAFVEHGAVVKGVKVPDNAYVDVGQEVTNQKQADALPKAKPEIEEFRAEVVDVNGEFAEGYIELYDEGEGYEEVIEAAPNPKTSFNPERDEPRVGEDATIGEFVRLVGDVRIGRGAEIGQRTVIRADEGTPIVIGERSRLEDRATFHALEETDIRIGDDLAGGDDAVFHGPLEMGDGVSVEDNAVVFRATVGDVVRIGRGAIIAGSAPDKEGGELPLRIPEGIDIPAGAVVTGPDDLKALCNVVECPPNPDLAPR